MVKGKIAIYFVWKDSTTGSYESSSITQSVLHHFDEYRNISEALDEYNYLVEREERLMALGKYKNRYKRISLWYHGRKVKEDKLY